MRKFAINQSGPAIGTGEIAYLVGEEGVEYFGATDTMTEALTLVNNYVPSNEPFTIVYTPWGS